MRTDSVRGQRPNNPPHLQKRQSPGNGFSRALDMQLLTHDEAGQRLPADWATPHLVHLGTISRYNPTVSHLLIRHPQYTKTIWRIIHANINQDKAFTKMQLGDKVFIDRITHEIVWYKKDDSPKETAVQANMDPSPDADASPRQNDSVSHDLVKAITPYLGSPYEKIDCFELVVQGLQKLGVRYHGPGGLRDRLVRMAVGKGLAKNAYFNGEGLIKASGLKVYSKSISRIEHSKVQAQEIFQEMEPFLERGFILSFSTPTRGHTGVISQKNHLWTYINSGNMDHQIGRRLSRKGVGEESLINEITNWVELAEKRNEPLLVTLGRLDQAKLRTLSI